MNKKNKRKLVIELERVIPSKKDRQQEIIEVVKTDRALEDSKLLKNIDDYRDEQMVANMPKKPPNFTPSEIRLFHSPATGFFINTRIVSLGKNTPIDYPIGNQPNFKYIGAGKYEIAFMDPKSGRNVIVLYDHHKKNIIDWIKS